MGRPLGERPVFKVNGGSLNVTTLDAAPLAVTPLGVSGGERGEKAARETSAVKVPSLGWSARNVTVLGLSARAPTLGWSTLVDALAVDSPALCCSAKESGREFRRDAVASLAAVALARVELGREPADETEGAAVSVSTPTARASGESQPDERTSSCSAGERKGTSLFLRLAAGETVGEMQ